MLPCTILCVCVFVGGPEVNTGVCLSQLLFTLFFEVGSLTESRAPQFDQPASPRHPPGPASPGLGSHIPTPSFVLMRQSLTRLQAGLELHTGPTLFSNSW